MKSFVLNITNRCNFKCGHCFREGASNEDLSLELLKTCLPTLKNLGVARLALTGGEPILHRRFAALVDTLAEEGFQLGIVTNGWLYRRYLETLRPHRDHVSYMALSLDSHSPAEHDRVRAKAGSFTRVLEAIQAFQEAGFRVNISHIVNRRTVSDLFSFGSFIADKDVFVNIGAVIPAEGNEPWRLDAGQRSRLPLTISLLRRKLRHRICATTSLGLNHEYLFCRNFANMNDVAIRYNGDVLFCCDCPTSNRGAVLGNLAEEPLGDILTRFPGRVAAILKRRLAAMAAGAPRNCDDCAFCCRVLREDFAKAPTSLQSGRAETIRVEP